jgi:hypothetical protein
MNPTSVLSAWQLAIMAVVPVAALAAWLTAIFLAVRDPRGRAQASAASGTSSTYAGPAPVTGKGEPAPAADGRIAA